MGSLCSVLSLQTFKPGAGYFLIPLRASLWLGRYQSLCTGERECQVVPREDIKTEWAACKTDGTRSGEPGGALSKLASDSGPFGSKVGIFLKVIED